MSITAQRVRQLVAALADAHEGAHHGHADFRLNNKIFATLSEAEDRAALRLTSVEARALSERAPDVFRLVSDREPVTWVSVLLASADETEFADLLEQAWSLRASNKPITQHRSSADERRDTDPSRAQDDKHTQSEEPLSR